MGPFSFVRVSWRGQFLSTFNPFTPKSDQFQISPTQYEEFGFW